MPATFSWRSALTVLMRSREISYWALDFRRNTRVATASSGSTAKTARASPASITSRAAKMPRKVSRLTTAVTTPVCRNEVSESRSVVIRVMIRPESSRS